MEFRTEFQDYKDEMAFLREYLTEQGYLYYVLDAPVIPDNKPGQLFRQRHGNRADSPEILRHILANPAIAPGSATDKHTVPVFQRHGQSIHLRLHGIFRVWSQRLLHPLAEGRDLRLVEYIL